jgi:prepilin signal peptidase PulO-like enzyme (type II secretory pathway)
MMRGSFASGNGRVSPVVPVVVVLAGLACAVAGYTSIGIGVAVGAVLAYMNALVLSRRVDMAADLGNIGLALLSMQLGLLLSATIIGIVVVVLIHFSLTLAVAAAAGFAVAQIGGLAVFYWTRARGGGSPEGEASQS